MSHLFSSDPDEKMTVEDFTPCKKDKQMGQSTSWTKDNQPLIQGEVTGEQIGVKHDPGSKQLKDSGERQQFTTGAVRDTSSGKGRYDLLQCHAIHRVAQTLEKGSIKYSERNWEKGIPVSRFLDSGLRHTLQYLSGNRDEDHLAQAAWNLMCAIETENWVHQGKLPKLLLLDADKDNENYTSMPDVKITAPKLEIKKAIDNANVNNELMDLKDELSDIEDTLNAYTMARDAVLKKMEQVKNAT